LIYQDSSLGEFIGTLVHFTDVVFEGTWVSLCEDIKGNSDTGTFGRWDVRIALINALGNVGCSNSLKVISG